MRLWKISILAFIRAASQTQFCRSNAVFNHRLLDTCPRLLSHHRSFGTMATAATVNVTPPTAGGFGLKDLSNESASRASKVLQENHEKHHIYFNNQGYHGKLEKNFRLAADTRTTSMTDP